MAIQKQSLAAAELDWFMTRSGMPANAPLNEHKAAYFAARGFGSNATIFKPVTQMESEWLSNLTGVTGSHSTPDQWVEAVAKAGLIVSPSMNENRKTYFANKTGNP